MADGGKVARRSTRAFADDVHPGHKKASSELHSPSVRGREEKISEMGSHSSRESSVSSGPVTEFEMELRKGPAKHEAPLEGTTHALRMLYLFSSLFVSCQNNLSFYNFEGNGS